MAELPESEKSLWREAYPKQLYPRLDGDQETDVVIIGAGITGLTAAYLLAKSGQKVIVVDKDTVGGGTTGRTTGKVTSQHGFFYKDLIDRIGQDASQKYAEANQAALELIEKTVVAEDINCGWQREDNYVFTADHSKVNQFKAEAEAATSLGLPASFVTDTPLPFEIASAVKFSDQAKIVAQQYVIGIAAAVIKYGGRIYEDTNVMGIRDGQPCRVRTRHGTVRAKHVVVATNVPTLPLMARGGYCILEYPTESYIVAGQVDEKIPGMYISPDKDHYSILPMEFEGKSYLLVGGGGHLSGMRISKSKRYNRLAEYGDKYFGLKPEYTWSDRDYSAYDKIPLVGKLYPWSKNLYVATAFNKWGLSGGTAAAMMLADVINGQPTRWMNVFTPQRLKPILSIPRAVVEQAKQQFLS